MFYNLRLNLIKLINKGRVSCYVFCQIIQFDHKSLINNISEAEKPFNNSDS